MSEHAEQEQIVPPDVSHLVTEDDAPVDSIFQEKQMRLLVEPLYSSWRPLDAHGAPRPFVAAADVGIFASVHERAIVPDVLLALDVEVPDEFWRKDRRSYYLWEFGKPPEVVVEIVSNREGDELEGKRASYSKLRIAHYVVFDHLRLLGSMPLRIFELRGDLLVPAAEPIFPRLGLALTSWTGRFEGKQADWLRWCCADGTLIPTGEERAEQERERAEQERERAEQERERAEQERERAERLASKLRELGIDPE
ncbi:MAG: Uma2 family endonuclease [Polyangiaceae bacterium]|nr:Uma2 family endonuclease [Polyangiaceae bacterium]